VDIKTIYARAKRGMRDDVKLYAVAVSSLTVAFLCLATALLGVANIAELADHWGRTHRMSVYLQQGAAEQEVARLTRILGSLSSVAKAEYTSPAAARERFLREAAATNELGELPAEAFPASVEVTFVRGASDKEISEVARRVALHRLVVDGVDTYRNWFERVGALLATGRLVALGLGLLVVLCVMAVVSNTIRLAVANRREEIEVLKMCGATDSFVRAPFLLEGTLQGLCAALFSLSLLGLVFLALRPHVDATLSAFAGVQLVFLQPLMIGGLLLGGALVGAVGSAISVRRYITV
jgi:cell division transport system permease protein